MRLGRRRQPAPRLAVRGDPVLRAGATAQVEVDTDTPGQLRVSLRLLGWDMRRARKWPLAERDVAPGTQALDVELPTGLPPGCARMTEYAVIAELGGTVAAMPVRLVGDEVWWPGGEPAEPRVVALGDVLRGHVDEPGEVGAVLHAAGSAEPRFLAVAAVEGDFAVPIGPDVPPTLHDGEELGISWAVRAGGTEQRFAVVDPKGIAGERRPPLLTFLAQLARDPFTPRRGG